MESRNRPRTGCKCKPRFALIGAGQAGRQGCALRVNAAAHKRQVWDSLGIIGNLELVKEVASIGR